MNRAVGVVLGLAAFAPTIALTAPGQESKAGAAAANDDAKVVEILKRADAATKKVKVVSYRVSLKGTGALEERVPTLSGKVILAGRSEKGLDKFRIEFEGHGPDGEEMAGTAGSDSREFFLLDPKTKTAHVDEDSSIFGSLERWLPVLGMREFVHPTPFSDEINGDKKELKGTQKIGDHDCYKIHVVYSGGRGEANWYFSKSDFLPRGVERLERGVAVTLTDLKVDPKIDPSLFEAKIPEAWKKTDKPVP